MSFLFGMITALFITMVTTTTPDEAIKNLAKWRDFLLRMFKRG
jgi:hypothetical protein